MENFTGDGPPASPLLVAKYLDSIIYTFATRFWGKNVNKAIKVKWKLLTNTFLMTMYYAVLHYLCHLF